MLEIALLGCAAFLAGALNTVAGGGTFLTLPALIFAGVPPVVANATSAVAVAPGYLGGVAGFRRELATVPRRLLVRTAAAALGGGLVGSLLLLISTNEAFAVIVPFLLAAATLIFVFAERIQIRATSSTSRTFDAPTISVAIYGGYFNGGLGIVLLALFALQGFRDLGQMNALKNAASLIISAVSVLTFSLAGLVAWPQAIVMMLCATAGGYLGAPVARMLPPRFIRFVIIFVGSAMTLIFFSRLFD